MKAFKYLVVIAALVVIGGMVADSWAQCQPGRLFRSSGKLGQNLDFDPTGSENAGNQIGYIWDTDDVTNSNSGLAPGAYGTLCPISDWWKERVSPLKQIDGVQGAGICIGAGMGCPADRLSVVVEDYEAGFPPPGVGGNAYFLAVMVNETPASGRWWDYGQLEGLPNNSVIPMVPYPEVVITGSMRSGGAISVSYALPDLDDRVHTTNWVGGAPAGTWPTGDVIAEWQLVKATGVSDPGRMRTAGWVTIKSTPYVPGGAPDTFVVPCSSTATDEFLAIGIGFNGGTQVIDSALVGKAIPLECDPNVAQPDDPAQFDRKGTPTQLDSKPLRSGGRR